MAILLGKISKLILHLFQKGGTAFPGLVAKLIDAQILSDLTGRVKFGSIVVTGTNGKTTTARLISEILDKNGYVVINNRSGSNLERGLIASFLDVADWSGNVAVDVAVLEIDEADLINLVGKLSLRQLIITNFFRDQLDRYGELLALRDLVKKAIAEMSAGSSLIINADDPLVASLADDVPEGVKVRSFGLNIDLDTNDYALDGRECIKCGHELKYRNKYLAHLGNYSCAECGYHRVTPDIAVTDWVRQGLAGSNLQVRMSENLVMINLPLPGLYNVYNLLAAVSSVTLMEVDTELMQDAVVKFKPVFGRFEKVVLGDQLLYLMLAKNPTGFNELIKTISEHDEKLNLIFVLNDNYADGRDISWIWDIDMERLRDKINWLVVSGTRAEEMNLRVKYANFNMERVAMEKNYHQLIKDIKFDSKIKEVFVLSTYTGMLDFRRELQKIGLVNEFWRD